MKTFNRDSLLRTSVLAGLMASGAAFTPALAQEDDADAPEQTQPAQAQPTETIQVTGSRIVNPNLVSASPITSVDSEEFDLTGTTRVEDLLNTLPQVAPSFDSFTVNPSTGTATADLRGLGTNRTLVLVNGNRLQPGGIRTQAPDLNQIPAALVERVEVLTGGASAVYGADAMAGVVNFILDREFEGVSISAGVSGYQHNNRNDYVQGLADDAGFDYPSGSSGIDGRSYDFDAALGSQFADGRGHASGYFTYRKNEELFQGDRDYSSCALSAAGTACGGSGTSIEPTFLVSGDTAGDDDYSNDSFSLNDDGSWAFGGATPYNFAPVNFYMRPDERWTFGGFFSYEVTPLFRPYMDFNFANTNTDVQIAESGTFFADNLGFECDDPIIGTLCDDAGIVEDPEGDDVNILVGKRNNEGGPRRSIIDSNSFRWVLGSEGDFASGWTYNASLSYGVNSSQEVGENDFLRSEIETAIRNCGDPELQGTPACYDVFTPGGVTPEAAANLAGTSVEAGRTELLTANAYVQGDTGITVPSATDSTSVVFGVEHRRESYEVIPDSNTQIGNFAGAGGAAPPVAGEYDVNEVFGEAIIPLVQDREFVQNLGLELGYRYSNYNTSGGVTTYKVAGNWEPVDMIRLRGGYNRAIRAANVGELFSVQSGGLWAGDDPCAGANPSFTLEQCQRTGVSADQYGGINASPASQYNQITGGNEQLQPEQADTYTFGAVISPFSNLNVTVDYYDITIEDRIGSIGASNILRGCAQTGDPGLCSLINRNPNSGDLWAGSAGDPGVGSITNLSENFGNFVWRGVDFTAAYATAALGGNVSLAFNGSLALEQTVDPLPGINDEAAYDCAGNISSSCQTPTWRHTARLSYDMDTWWSASVRWRHVGSMDYEETDGSPGTTDAILVNNGNQLDAVNYLDLSGRFTVNDATSFTLGVNNVTDEEPPVVGSTLAFNANSPGGYDQVGRYLFATINLRY